MSLVTVSTYVDVEIEIDEIHTEDLIAELELRGELPEAGSETKEDITEMFYAFHLGRTDRAMALAKKIAQDVTGRNLA